MARILQFRLPATSEEKLKELVVLLLNRLGPLTWDQVCWALWKVDGEAFLCTGKSITGCQYFKFTDGTEALMADIVDIHQKRKEREANWWKWHDAMEAKLLASSEDAALLKSMVTIAECYHEALTQIAEGADEVSSAVAAQALECKLDLEDLE